MPPKTKAKRKAEQASKLGVDAHKKQRLSLESVESIPVAVEMASTSSGCVNESLLPNSTLEPGFPRKICLINGSITLDLKCCQQRKVFLLMAMNVMML